MTVVSNTLSWGVGVIVRLVGYYGRDIDELASPLIQVLPEVVIGLLLLSVEPAVPSCDRYF